MNRTLAALLLVSCAGVDASGHGASLELAAFADYLKTAHPDPWRSITRPGFESVLASEQARLEAFDHPSDLELTRACLRLSAALRDAHLAVTSGPFQTASSSSFLPLVVTRVQGHWRIDATIDESLVGAEVVAIDELAMSTLIAEADSLVSADAQVESARWRAIAQSFTLFFHVMHGFHPTYQIEIEDLEGARRTVTLGGIAITDLRELAVRRRTRVAWAPPGAGPLPFLVANPPPRTSWLRLATFGPPDPSAYQVALEALLPDALSQPRLVIDLRGNEGGYRNLAFPLLNRLIAHPYTQWSRASSRLRELPPRFRDSVSGAFGFDLEGLRAFTTPIDTYGFVNEGDPLRDEMTPSGATYDGQIFVVVDGGTNSAANELVVSLLAARPDVMVVGEEAGGACDAHVGEVPSQWSSRAFSVKALVSLVRLTLVSTPRCRPGTGIQPELEVSLSLEDFVAGTDPVRRRLSP